MGEAEIEIDVFVGLVGVDAVLVLGVVHFEIVEQCEEGFLIDHGDQDGAVNFVDRLAEADIGAEGARRVDAFEPHLADLAFDQSFDLLGGFFLAHKFDDEVEVLQKGVERFNAHHNC